jgi:hypothetical protein
VVFFVLKNFSQLAMVGLFMKKLVTGAFRRVGVCEYPPSPPLDMPRFEHFEQKILTKGLTYIFLFVYLNLQAAKEGRLPPYQA